MNSPKDTARTKLWVKNNPERSRAIKQRYKDKNREKVLAAERERARNKRALMTDEEKAVRREYNRIRHHKTYYSNTNKRIKIALRTRLYKALKGIAKCKKTEQLLGCTIASFKIYLESKFEPGMSWENYGKWHIDHIIPCAVFDLSRPDHQRYCFHFSNMQPLWGPDNIRKSDSVDPIWTEKIKSS